MSIYSKRNALVGAFALFFARRYAKRKLGRVTGKIRFNR